MSGDDDRHDEPMGGSIVPALRARIDELDAIVSEQRSMLDQIAMAARFRLGDSYTSDALINALRRQGAADNS